MSHLHPLILIPYYFVSALAVLPALLVVSRFLRLKVAINTLVSAAIALSIAGIVVPLAADWVDLDAFTGRPLLLLVLTSLGLSTLDLALKRLLPLPLDDEMQQG